jgi:hypothetical protein
VSGKLPSESYRPTGILTQQQNSYASHSRHCTGHHEMLSREPDNKGNNNLPVYISWLCRLHQQIYFGHSGRKKKTTSCKAAGNHGQSIFTATTVVQDVGFTERGIS